MTSTDNETITKTGNRQLPSVKKKKTKKAKKRKKTFGWPLTLLMWAVLFALIACLWALFISGPARIYEEQQKQTISAIEQQVPAIEGLEENDFDYVTWQGYTDDTLYWFDASGGIITTRSMSSLNYQGAREKAQSQYGMEPVSVTLAYGYSGPVYQLESEEMILMLDYDSLEWVYERNFSND